MFTKFELEKFLKSSLKACLHVDVHMIYTELLGMATETFNNWVTQSSFKTSGRNSNRSISPQLCLAFNCIYILCRNNLLAGVVNMVRI